MIFVEREMRGERVDGERFGVVLTDIMAGGAHVGVFDGGFVGATGVMIRVGEYQKQKFGDVVPLFGGVGRVG